MLKWFDERLLSSNTRAFGVYLALFKVRLAGYMWPGEVPSSLLQGYIDEIREEASKLLSGRELYEVISASRILLEQMFKNEGRGSRMKRASELLEARYYERLRSACYTFYRRSAIPKELREPIKAFLRDVRTGVIRRVISDVGSAVLSYHVMSPVYRSYWDGLGVVQERAARALSYSGIVVFGRCVSGAFLEERFIENLQPPEEPDFVMVQAYPESTSSEVLEEAREPVEST